MNGIHNRRYNNSIDCIGGNIKADIHWNIKPFCIHNNQKPVRKVGFAKRGSWNIRTDNICSSVVLDTQHIRVPRLGWSNISNTAHCRNTNIFNRSSGGCNTREELIWLRKTGNLIKDIKTAG